MQVILETETRAAGFAGRADAALNRDIPDGDTPRLLLRTRLQLRLRLRAAIQMMVRPAYIVAARRTAIGRIGGLHRQRRVEDLAAPVVHEVLKDAGVSPAQVERLILGNASAGGNPARLVALTAGLPESAAATSIDQQCASGLEAILSALRIIGAGEAEVVVAGGAEALSMAPWRIAKPRNIHQSPRFIDLIGSASGSEGGDASTAEVGETLARTYKISRHQQDDFALRTHMKAGLAREARRFLKEIVALKAVAEETRDQSSVEPDLQDLQDLPPLLGDGSLTSANTSAPHDGAAFVVVVSEAIWTGLGKPPALKLVASATVGVSPPEAGEAAITAMRRLAARVPGLDLGTIGIVEMSETSAAEAIALRNALGVADEVLNPDGGAIARGHPLGAASAVLVVRLFSRMARSKDAKQPKLGVAVLSALGGQGAAALFERA